MTSRARSAHHWARQLSCSVAQRRCRQRFNHRQASSARMAGSTRQSAVVKARSTIRAVDGPGSPVARPRRCRPPRDGRGRSNRSTDVDPTVAKVGFATMIGSANVAATVDAMHGVRTAGPQGSLRGPGTGMSLQLAGTAAMGDRRAPVLRGSQRGTGDWRLARRRRRAMACRASQVIDNRPKTMQESRATPRPRRAERGPSDLYGPHLAYSISCTAMGSCRFQSPTSPRAERGLRRSARRPRAPLEASKPTRLDSARRGPRRSRS